MKIQSLFIIDRIILGIKFKSLRRLKPSPRNKDFLILERLLSHTPEVTLTGTRRMK